MKIFLYFQLNNGVILGVRMKRKVYLDNNSTTPVDPRVLNAMLPYLKDRWGNPNNIHEWGREAREAVENARRNVAKMLNCEAREIYFTSGGTEGNNMVIKGIAFANMDEGKHIITTAIEHKCVLNTCKWLEKQGFEITYLKVDSEGFVDMNHLEESLRKDTILVSVMLANNEIGTIEPLEEIVKIVREKSDAYVHTDACQAIGKIEVNVRKLDVDAMTISGHKFYAPKGIGAVYLRTGVKIEPLLHGGGQERDVRSGTENVPGIVGIGRAAELVIKELENDKNKLRAMQKKLINGVLDSIDDVLLNGPNDLEKRLPGNANFSIKYIEGEALILKLDDYGIAASTGSACSSKQLIPSHVLTAIGLKPEVAHGSVRFSAGRFNEQEDIDYVLEVLPKVVEELRALSPLTKESL